MPMAQHSLFVLKMMLNTNQLAFSHRHITSIGLTDTNGKTLGPAC